MLNGDSGYAGAGSSVTGAEKPAGGRPALRILPVVVWNWNRSMPG